MVIQRVERGMASPASHSGGAMGANREGNPGSVNAQGSANEVNLLANDVWAHIKGKIKAEGNRRGRF